MARTSASRLRALPASSLLALCAACATYVDEPPVPGTSSLVSGGAGGDVAAAGTGGEVASAGSLPNGNPSAGTASGASGSGTSGGVDSGGAAGHAGAGGASGGNGGGGSGGGAGKAGGGAGGGGGSGGSNAVTCAQHPIRAKAQWQVTASASEGVSPPSRAHDGDLNNRWTTGKIQSGDEWLQIDFGADTTLTKLTLVLGTSIDDYPRMYQTRVSNSAGTVAPVLLSGSGQKSTDTVMSFAKGTHGRFVHISQTGSVPALWWSIAEIQAECAD